MAASVKVHQKTMDFADRVLAVTEGFPRGYGFLADQLNRAATLMSEGRDIRPTGD